ncbi:ribosome hibernation-promoting factor, HPF/YfiA family [Demequina lutea]|uniref:Ribosome hibernation promoting factor n=1 Tax=Demequina lutea TaxID=431489 RepID=A0A7Z0CJI0_9MICO|nr:ribosome-associated translation inhibitor RaiA [Demequina lutea]NYI40802.1 ribosomal subunit interface protein [Demequina lutea]
MDIAIVGRHTKVNDDMRGRIATKMEKLSALAPLATRAEVHVVHERNPKLSTDAERVEITLHGRAVVRAEASAEDRVAALELATIRVIEQLRKLHERRAHRHQGKADMATFAMADMTAAQAAAAASEVESVEAWDGQPASSVREIPLDGTPIMIRSKVHSAEPMSISEAIDQMELVGHDFFLFLDSDSGMPSAVYRRRGWTYGVIQLDQVAAEVERASA